MIDSWAEIELTRDQHLELIRKITDRIGYDPEAFNPAYGCCDRIVDKNGTVILFFESEQLALFFRLKHL